MLIVYRVNRLVAFRIAAISTLACVIFWRPILNDLGQFLIASDSPEQVDAILVLGGDFYGPRVLRGAELGRQGFAPRVLITGPPYNDRPESELAIEFLVKNGYPRNLFVSLPHQAKSTIDEAIALAPQLARLNVKKAILVTRASHTRRAKIVFGLFCPGIHFYSVAAQDNLFKAEAWWSNSESNSLFFLEWSKIVATILLEYPWHRIAGFVHRENLP
jgi:uncharacterized SAM-binding protein YcdF (DUF218 family)